MTTAAARWRSRRVGSSQKSAREPRAGEAQREAREDEEDEARGEDSVLDPLMPVESLLGEVLLRHPAIARIGLLRRSRKLWTAMPPTVTAIRARYNRRRSR